MKKVLIALIRLYQRTISVKTPPSCRFTPTCSAYAIQAIERFGVIKGCGLAVWRILRCNPFGKGGYDPVPEKRDRKARKEKLGNPQGNSVPVRAREPLSEATGETARTDAGGGFCAGEESGQEE